FNFCSNISHSSIGYANKHLSSPRVTTNVSPSPSRNLDGPIIRPLSSMLWLNSPMTIQLTPLSYFYVTTFNHNSPPTCKKKYPLVQKVIFNNNINAFMTIDKGNTASF